MSCLIVGQTATVREQLCNYLQPEFSTVYHADVRPSPALTMERLADSGVRKLTRPVTTSAFGRSRPAADASREVEERWLLYGL